MPMAFLVHLSGSHPAELTEHVRSNLDVRPPLIFMRDQIRTPSEQY